jgi:NADH:ubiquinone oxidoreductase subunit 5 (subunit L)/multisubunit Na+/H+ antiporter MnhA subunit
MPQLELLLPAIVFTPFGAAALALCLGKFAGKRTGVLMVLSAAGSFLGCLQLVAIQTPVGFMRGWIPGLSVALSFRGDPFGLFFALLISGIGTLVGIYALGYMPSLAPRRLGQFYAALLAFMGAMLGVALSDDLILLFVFWEATSVTSFILIGFWYEQEEARKGAWTALQVTALGGMVMLAGFVLIGLTCGTYSLHQLIQSRELQARLVDSSAFVPALLLILAGALTKSAQWPFHFWLPRAMVAPTPISTYLHAATMVKAGIFLLGRMLPLFGGAGPWTAILVPIGLVTFLLGAYQALTETDLKAILARSTVSTLGLFTAIYGLATPDQDALGIFAHATYKGALFLVAGIVEHATHTRDIRQLGGLRTRMPVTFSVAVLAALSMAGVYPTLGFHAKEALYESLLHGPRLAGSAWQEVVLVACVAANALIFAAAARFVSGVFLGKPSAHAGHAHEASPILWGPPALLAGLALLMGLAAPVTEQMVGALSSRPGAALHVSLAPAMGGPLLLSAATFCLAVLCFWARDGLDALRRGRPAWLGTEQIWDVAMAGVVSGATAFSSRWQSGSLRWYLSGSLMFTVGLSGLALWHGGLSLRDVVVRFEEMQWYGVALCAMLTASAVMVVRSRTRIGAALSLAANGFLTATLFVVYRSPDILLTQILIESVSTIFILLVLYFMPPFRTDGFSPMRKAFNVAVSLAVGLCIFVFIMFSTSPAFRETNNLAADYLTRSLAEAGGANAVNVIIVDFRAIDTNAEITVLMVVGLLVYGLLRSRRRSP